MQGMMEMVTPACSMPQSVPPRLVDGTRGGQHQRQRERVAAVHHHQRAEELVPRR